MAHWFKFDTKALSFVDMGNGLGISHLIGT